ncbi:MAG: hypothetical protein M0042_06465 [Nitrospiraceae bacterium]|nr:hypothetical protein [Nitrospiraceae bacterium]
MTKAIAFIGRMGMGAAFLGMLLAAQQVPAQEAQPLSLPTETAPPVVEAPAPKPPEPIEMSYVRPVTTSDPGRNDGNPSWSRSGMFLTFERSVGEKKDVRVFLADLTEVQTVYHQIASGAGGVSFYFPGVVEDISYNAGLSWSPDENHFVFMSNGGAGNYDLYEGELGAGSALRLTDHKEKDGQPDWSPRANAVVFVSGRTGKGDLYLLDLETKTLVRLTRGGREYLYPQWSPDGKRIAFMAGSNENHDIFVMDAPALPPPAPPQPAGKGAPKGKAAAPAPAPQVTVAAPKAVTAWSADDLRPVWSPDGTKLAFYSNYNSTGDPRIWSIFVVAADGSDATEGDGLAAKVVAADVVPDVERGPAWMPDSSRIVYVRNDRKEYHPIYMVDSVTRESRPLRTETKMNHDVSCGPDGTIAFRAQVDQWDQVFVAKMKE